MQADRRPECLRSGRTAGRIHRPRSGRH